MEGSEGLRWWEGERSDCCCRWADSSWLADMVEGWADGLQVLLRAHCLLACLLLRVRLLYRGVKEC